MTVPSRQADEALDRLIDYAGWATTPKPHKDAVATVRDELGRLRSDVERLTKERDAAHKDGQRWRRYHGAMQVRAEAAEAEVRQLREDKVKLHDWGSYWKREARRLTEGLREIAEARVEYRRDGHGFSHHLLDKDGNYLGSAAPKLQDMSRALLAASPTNGDCTNCDGKGHYTGWPHTTCPVCGGTGNEPDGGGAK